MHKNTYVEIGFVHFLYFVYDQVTKSHNKKASQAQSQQ